MPTVADYSSLRIGNLIIYRSRVEDLPDQLRYVTPEVYTELMLNEAIAISVELDREWLEVFGFRERGEFLELTIKNQTHELQLKYRWPQQDHFHLNMEVYDRENEQSRELICYTVHKLQNLIEGITGKAINISQYPLLLSIDTPLNKFE
ncbi:hypothetical protein Q0590_08915 [Rhodocytophaga aerolata]|uniref:Uncharacterized protein n=2 Tax=Rhodocytophaga aerolata TaxID=455078 RepID=A0ABT8R2N9_9BACT|nr:hypothetical protein [Rhodocytophaga aerolata]MDO1446369.1 hypothetical protein [Rhodocytophaga aerolata]